MKHFISIIIPNYNGGKTIGKCLESIFAVRDDDREVIIVDDGSEDRSQDIIRGFPCSLIQLEKHAGASAARNAGALISKGDILFFIDADCLVQKDTLAIIRSRFTEQPPNVAIGGTYTLVPHDLGFFSRFQSAFINYSETKNGGNPDYIATHALALRAEAFRKLGGFMENFILPILEDVEFSHRLRRAGYRLMMDPDLEVTHIFNFSFPKSLRNAVRKTRYWIMYSLSHRDIFADSGTASREIKIHGGVWLVTILLSLLFLLSGHQVFLIPLPLLWGVSIIVSRNFFKIFYRAGGASFAIPAGFYYMMIYPAAIWLGAFEGVVQYAARKTRQPDQGDPFRSTSSESLRK